MYLTDVIPKSDVIPNKKKTRPVRSVAYDFPLAQGQIHWPRASGQFKTIFLGVSPLPVEGIHLPYLVKFYFKEIRDLLLKSPRKKNI